MTARIVKMSGVELDAIDFSNIDNDQMESTMGDIDEDSSNLPDIRVKAMNILSNETSIQESGTISSEGSAMSGESGSE